MTYNLFISHSWNYNNHYDRLLEMLNNYPNFRFRDYSVPKDDPIIGARNNKQLVAAITNQMQNTSCIIILAGVYASYSEWIQKEIEIAKHEFYNPKPIIAVELWGAERTSQIVKNNADMIVKWNTASIVGAIRELCQ